MHNLYFVLVAKANAANSLKARQTTDTFLINNNFAGGEGMFSGSKADWFVVGGRWSGLLSELTIAGQAAVAAIKVMLDKDYPSLESGIEGVHYGDKAKEKTKQAAIKKANAIWKKHGLGLAMPCLADRDSYKRKGYKDDAMLITKKLLVALRKEYNDCEVCVMDDYNESVLADMPDKDLINNWLVVIDYHC